MVQNWKKKLKKMGGLGGGHGRAIIFAKNIFRKKKLRSGTRGLGAHFPPPYPRVTPPRVSAGQVRQVRIFSKKKIEKNSIGRKKS